MEVLKVVKEVIQILVDKNQMLVDKVLWVMEPYTNIKKFLINRKLNYCSLKYNKIKKLFKDLEKSN